MQTVAKGAKQDQTGRFTPADVVASLDASWLDEMTCRMWLLLQLHHRGAQCPGCGRPITEAQRLSFSNFKRICCGGCGKYFNGLTGTFLSGVKDVRQVVLQAYLIGIGLSDSVIADQLGVDRKSVWRCRKKFEAMKRG